MNWKRERGLYEFYIVVLMIIISITGNTINRINLHKILNEIEKEGINYDNFREMRLSEEMIGKVKESINEAEKVQTMDNPLNSLTLYMLVNHYDPDKSIKIRKQNEKYLLGYLSADPAFLELKTYYSSILKDVKCFPVPKNEEGKAVAAFDDSWNSPRTYGGNRLHEGTDIMPEENKRGYYPIVSMTEGTVEKMGWLDQGGYRVGIRSSSGVYYYYAHLYSYAPGLEIGNTVASGEFLGLMGDSGYGPEGTVGKFDVHLHVGIYVPASSGDLSVNPYCILRYLEKE